MRTNLSRTGCYPIILMWTVKAVVYTYFIRVFSFVLLCPFSYTLWCQRQNLWLINRSACLTSPYGDNPGTEMYASEFSEDNQAFSLRSSETFSCLKWCFSPVRRSPGTLSLPARITSPVWPRSEELKEGAGRAGGPGHLCSPCCYCNLMELGE